MRDSTTQTELLEAARDAIDEDRLEEVLEAAFDHEVDDQTVRSLQETAAEEILLTVELASARARRRARCVCADDIASCAEERRKQPSGTDPTDEVYISRWEGE